MRWRVKIPWPPSSYADWPVVPAVSTCTTGCHSRERCEVLQERAVSLGVASVDPVDELHYA